MSLGDYLVGLAVLGVTAGSSAVVARWLLHRRLDHLRGAQRTLAWGLLFTAAFIGVHLLPAALGILSRVTVVATALALAVLASRLRPCSPGRPGASPTRPRSGSFSWALAGLALVIVAVAAGASLHAALAGPVLGIDALTFHLPGALAWMHTGSIWQIDQFVPYQAHGYYPNHGDVVLLAVVLPFHDDFLMRLVFVPWWALTGVAVYALATDLGAPRATAALVAAVVLALPNMFYDVVHSTLPDVVMLSTFVAGLVFLLRHQRTDARSDLLLAGLGLGLAFGTKWHGVSSVVAVTALWALAMLVARRGVRRVAVDGGVLMAAIAAAGGIWLLRNLVLSGNPVFPLKVMPFGITIFDAPRDVVRELGGFSISDYAGQPQIWVDYFVPAFGRALGFAPLVLGAGAVTAVALTVRGLRRPDGRDRREGHLRRLAAAAVAVALLAVYTITPYSAFGAWGDPVFTFVNVRYGLPALLVAAGLAAAAAGWLGRWRPVLEVALVVTVVDGLRRAADVPTGSLVRVILLLLGAAAAVVAVRTLGRRGWLRPAVGRAVAVACALAVVSTWAYRHENRAEAHGHAPFDPTFAYVADRMPSATHVGLVGTWSTNGVSPVVAMFGPRLGNDVQYVGTFVDGMLREHRSRSAFLDDVRRRRLDLILVGRGAPPRAQAQYEPWIRSAGWRKVAASRRFALYRRPGS